MSRSHNASAPRWKSGASVRPATLALLALTALVACDTTPREAPVMDFGAVQDGVTMPRAALLAQIQARLDQLSHVRREPSSPGGPDDKPEDLAASEAKLSREDLQKIRLLLMALQDRATVADILRLGAEDRADTDTEHGGVLDVDAAGRLTLTVVPPMLTGDDMAYIASDRGMALAATSLAMFHMHFSHVDSAEDAGPSAGDLAFAAANKVTCVVFSSLSESSFDADYYTPAGAVVDLGIYNKSR